MLPDGALAGRVALGTGGGSGLGRAMALELGRLGAKLAVLGRRRHVLEETVAQLGDGVAVPGDAREPNVVAAAFDVAEAELGPITTLVNKPAGDFHVKAEELSPNGWRAVVGIVLDGTYYCSRAGPPRDRARRRQRPDRQHRRELPASRCTVSEPSRRSRTHAPIS